MASSPERSVRYVRFVSLFNILATLLIWLGSLPLVCSQHFRWAGALGFILGLVFLVRWQIARGPKIA